MFEDHGDGKLRYAATGFFCRYFTGGAEGRTLLFLVTTARAVSGNLGDTRLVCWPASPGIPQNQLRGGRQRRTGAGRLAC